MWNDIKNKSPICDEKVKFINLNGKIRIGKFINILDCGDGVFDIGSCLYENGKYWKNISEDDDFSYDKDIKNWEDFSLISCNLLLQINEFFYYSEKYFENFREKVDFLLHQYEKISKD